MGDTFSWKILKSGSGPDLILAADFPVTGRPEAAFFELADRMNSREAVWETITPELGAAATMTASDYVEHWLGPVRSGESRVRGVLGYCAGGVFAAAMADEIARWQQSRPSLVLFDPEIPTADTLHHQFLRALSTMSTVLTSDEVAVADKRARQACAELADLEAVGATLSDIFREVGRVSCERAGVGRTVADELLDTFVSFLTYLSKAGGINPLPAWATATAISSNTPTNGLNTLSQEQRDSLVAREIRFDVQHVDLLRDDEIAATVAELLGAGVASRAVGGGGLGA